MGINLGVNFSPAAGRAGDREELAESETTGSALVSAEAAPAAVEALFDRVVGDRQRTGSPRRLEKQRGSGCVGL
jgi:hypothetical protein